MDGGYGTSQMPLAGAILCCTSIPAEQRTQLAAVGAQMGATIKLDLTSDVTHLIVGNIDSAKYQYVAKSREDVKVLAPEWLQALRTVWMEGGDVDVAALEEEHRLPAFFGLKICLTGFDNPDQRKYLQETVLQNGAEYHGDLTKNVSHLIAASPSGKKYEHAINWKMKIVTWEWFEQSLQRGMALNESCYHPIMPPEERGKGAWDRRETTSPMLGKRVRDAEQGQLVNPLRRKLRRSASSRMGSQSEALWAGITAAGLERQANDNDNWTDDDPAETGLPKSDPPLHSASNIPSLRNDNTTYKHPASPARPASLQRHVNDGIFQGRAVFTCGFDMEKTNILREHLATNGASVVRDASELKDLPGEQLDRGFLVVPHDVPAGREPLPEGAGGMSVVTNWWVERCLHGKCLVDPSGNVLCSPFRKLGINGFSNLIINSTAFTGIELLQLTKIITLLGATYDEYLTPKTSVMVCNTGHPNADKVKFATDRGIPAVHASWLWECLQTGEPQPYDNHLLNTVRLRSQKRQQDPLGPFAEIPTAPLSEEDSAKLRKRKAQAARPSKNPQSRSSIRADLPIPSNSTPAPTTSSLTQPNTATDQAGLADSRPVIADYDGPASVPLQDINPSVNSPRRPSSSSNASTSTGNAKSSSTTTRSASISEGRRMPPSAAARASRLAKEPTPDSVIPAPSETTQEGKDYSSIMSALLARRRQAGERNADKDDDKRKRRRQLGRATSIRSNASTAEDALSRASSASGVRPVIDEDVDPLLGDNQDNGWKKTVVEVYQPSQELGWDAPGAQEARDQMIRAMGGRVEDTGGVMGPIGVVKDVVNGEVTNVRERRVRKRG